MRCVQTRRQHRKDIWLTEVNRIRKHARIGDLRDIGTKKRQKIFRNKCLQGFDETFIHRIPFNTKKVLRKKKAIWKIVNNRIGKRGFPFKVAEKSTQENENDFASWRSVLIK
jgi:hypothetical protein